MQASQVSHIATKVQEDSSPALFRIVRAGVESARRMMAIQRSWSKFSVGITVALGDVGVEVDPGVLVARAREALRRATPPPGKIPFSTAALVAFRASSYRPFFSLTSTSDDPPTLMTATLPESLASRSCNLVLSKSEVVGSAMSARICSQRAWMESCRRHRSERSCPPW
jgi:hypothetical protein